MSKLGGVERRLKDEGKDRLGEVEADVIFEKMPSALHSLFFIGCIVDFMEVMALIDKDGVANCSSCNFLSKFICHFPFFPIPQLRFFYSIHSTKSFEQLQPTGFAISELSSRILEQLLQALPIR